MFGRMFGKKEDKALSAGEAIQKLRETEEMLMKKQEYLEKKIEQVSRQTFCSFVSTHQVKMSTLTLDFISYGKMQI